MKKENQSYLASFEKYKKIPLYKTIITAICFLAWAIVDSNIVKEGYYSWQDTYGVLGFEEAESVLVFWLFVGAITCVITYLITKITISPVVLQTESLLSLENKFCTDNIDVDRE